MENDRERRRLQQRLIELRNQLFELSNGEAEFGPAGEGLALEDEVAWLEHIIAFETAPKTTWIARLAGTGYSPPDPTTLSDAEIGLEVWQVIQRLSEFHCYLESTDHLSDRELYERLYHTSLREETVEMPIHPDSACHLDLSGSGGDDLDCYLRYYADEDLREQWARDFPDDPLPPKEDLPYDRDRLLPKPSHEEAPLHRILDALLDADWMAEDGAIRFSPDLAPDAVESVPFVVAARALLETLRDTGPVKATASLKNLPRSVVNAVFPRLPLPDEKKDAIRAVCKVLDEPDIHYILAARYACQAAELVAFSKDRFSITQRGEVLLDPDFSGELYQALFLSLFHMIDLSVFDYDAELPGLQATLAVILWRMGIVARDWIPREKLAVETLIPDVIDEFIDAGGGGFDSPGTALDSRICRHLVDFGLLEETPFDPHTETAYRVTPLFDCFLEFHLPDILPGPEPLD